MIRETPYEIRPERADDAAERAMIAAVNAAAFDSPGHGGLPAALRATDFYRAEWSFVAVADDQVVGHVMIGVTFLHGPTGTSEPDGPSGPGAPVDRGDQDEQGDQNDQNEQGKQNERGNHGDHGDRQLIPHLSPLAVEPARQRQGIGSALVEAAVAAVDAAGEPFVVLEGSPDYYRRLGFEPAPRYGVTLPIPDWAPRDAGQLRKLSGYRPLTGAVVYPPPVLAAFEAVDTV